MSLELIEQTGLTAISGATSSKELEQLRVDFLGKKGQVTDLLKGLGKLSPEDRPKMGEQINRLKVQLSEAISQKEREIEDLEWAQKLSKDSTDTTLPPRKIQLGRAHPLTQTLKDIQDCFAQLGFTIKEGPDIETDHYNFEALNIPAHHPARDMHDTFYLTTGNVLRTHTSPVQIHVMESQAPPIKIIVPGKVYRCDADVTHSPCFHQIEGLVVDKDLSFAELKGTLSYFLKAMFGQKRQVRFRPSYFPFTEPSTEVDVQCFKCSGKGCNLCKQTGWLEILGAGMVHRNVLRAVNISPDEYTGFAFGLGIERIAMLRYEIQDIRLFYENDHRFLEQF